LPMFRRRATARGVGRVTIPGKRSRRPGGTGRRAGTPPQPPRHIRHGAARLGMVTSIANEILSLHGPLVYGLVAALAFGEAAVLLGFVLPGETAVILGGVIASQGNVNIVVMIVVATVAAIAGDSVGYEVGRLLGPRLLAVRPLRRRHAGVEKARDFIKRWGAWAVVLGRLTAFLRAVVPGLAGMGGMHYPRFLMAN